MDPSKKAAIEVMTNIITRDKRTASGGGEPNCAACNKIIPRFTGYRQVAGKKYHPQCAPKELTDGQAKK